MDRRQLTRRRLLAALPTASAISQAAAQRRPAPQRATASTLTGVRDLITPIDVFFIRDHFAEPDLAIGGWTLKVEGHIAQPLEITFSELLLAPSVRRDATLECAGNGARGFAVSTGVWKGVPLGFLLAAASPLPGAAEVLFEGADEGRLFTGASPGPYTRIVPLEHAAAPEAMVAYELNRQLLPRGQGFPARALLPGWYAMNSVKWLRRIVVLARDARPAHLRDTGMDQVYVRALKGVAGTQPLGRLQVKSAIAFPEDGARLPAGRANIWGFAWSGGQAVSAVRVSVDGGQNWRQARLESPPDPFRWTRWSLEWDAKPGDYALMSRAEDASGAVQPLSRDPRREDQYELNQCVRVNCSVR